MHLLFIFIPVHVFCHFSFKEFLQEVASYKPALETVNQSEVSLFATDLSSIGLHEAAVIKQAALYRRSSTPRSLAVASPSPIPALVSIYMCVCAGNIHV